MYFSTRLLKEDIYVGVFQPAESVCTSQLQRRRVTYSRIPFFEPLGKKRIGLNYREVGKSRVKLQCWIGEENQF